MSRTVALADTLTAVIDPPRRGQLAQQLVNAGGIEVEGQHQPVGYVTPGS